MIYCFSYIEENDAAEFVLKTSMIVEENVFFRNFAVVCCRACDRNLGGEKKPGLECVCVESRCSVGCWLLARLFAFTHVVILFSAYLTKRPVAGSVQP